MWNPWAYEWFCVASWYGDMRVKIRDEFGLFDAQGRLNEEFIAPVKPRPKDWVRGKPGLALPPISNGGAAQQRRRSERAGRTWDR